MAKGGLEPPTTAYETDKLPYSTSPFYGLGGSRTHNTILAKYSLYHTLNYKPFFTDEIRTHIFTF
jgi:hypothetical protein